MKPVEGWGRDHNGNWHAVTTRNHPAAGIVRCECSGGVMHVERTLDNPPPWHMVCNECKAALTRRIVEET